MIELIDTIPDTNVQQAEYKRLLGFPRDRVLEDRSRELAEWAREWYAQNGKPWLYARQAESLHVTNGSICIEDQTFSSKPLANMLAQAGADGAIVVAVSAGPEIEAASREAWSEERPDEYFFLEIYGSAVVEHLTTMTGGRLCAWAESRGMAVLPHYSPGYSDWDISQQAALLSLLTRGDKQPLPGPLESLDSGMLRPKKSLIAVFGLTHHTDRVRPLSMLVPCENCSFAPCQFRRAPYVRSPEFSKRESVAIDSDSAQVVEPVQIGLERNAKYTVNARALRRWAEDRLSLKVKEDGSVEALFRYDGTTCGDRSFIFHYHVTLGPRGQGYPIRAQSCHPAPGDEGHRHMCRYMNNAEHLMVAIDHEKPLLGQRLNDVLTWQRPTTGPGCHCEPSSRKHKWGLVLETIHFALVQREEQL